MQHTDNVKQKEWNNFVVPSLLATGKEGHIPAEMLPKMIASHHGREAYHSLFDLEPRGDYKDYKGLVRPSLGYVWFDFDSDDQGARALTDVKAFIKWLNNNDVVLFFSGNKGFHVGVPFQYFGLAINERLLETLKQLAVFLKVTYPTLDVAIYNAARKWRMPNSKHNKSSLFKIQIHVEELEGATIELIRDCAKSRMPLAPFKGATHAGVLTQLVDTLKKFEKKKEEPKEKAKKSTDSSDAFPPNPGVAAFKCCSFLQHCRDDAMDLSEPEWHKMLSIVSRFENGRGQCHELSREHPKYTPEETNKKIDHALKHGPFTCKKIKEDGWSGCAECPLLDVVGSPASIRESSSEKEKHEGKNYEQAAPGMFSHNEFWIENKNKSLSPNYELLLSAFYKDTEYFLDLYTENMYSYNGKYYEEITDISINAWCEKVMVPKPKNAVVKEFREKAKRNYIKKQTETEILFHDTIKGKFNFPKGILDIKNLNAENSLLDHSPSIGFRNILPYDYDPSATCPKFDQFLNNITLGREALQQTLLEFMGYCLWSGYEDHCILWLSGSGRNGKSTFCEIVQAIIGQDNCSNVLLSSMEDRTYLQTMDHKLVNIGEESDSAKIAPAILGNLKALSSGAHVQVHKKYGHPYAMRAVAKLIFASNKPPIFSGTEDALKSRLIVVPFDLQLEEHGVDGTTSKINWSLASDIIKNELPGVLNRALAALSCFLDPKRLPRKIHRSKISHDAMRDIMSDSDPMEEWFEDYIDYSSLEDIHGYDIVYLFQHFLECQGTDFKMELRWFGRKLKAKAGSKIKIKRVGRDNKKATFVYGLKLNPKKNLNN